VIYAKSDGRFYTKDDTGTETALQAFVEAGTQMLFQQTAAPTGWTKITATAYSDAALRFTTSVAGTGGTSSFTSTFGLSKTTAGFTLTTAEIPSHTHDAIANTGAGNLVLGSTVAEARPSGATGGGGSHTHNLSYNDIKFVDCIVATKD
jgi:hypothetical protein